MSFTTRDPIGAACQRYALGGEGRDELGDGAACVVGMLGRVGWHDRMLQDGLAALRRHAADDG